MSKEISRPTAVLDPYTSDLIYQIEAVQKRAARFVKKNDYDRRRHVSALFDNFSRVIFLRSVTIFSLP